jgi:pyruvate/2-oxoglutarate dehydrogenase complex dihydrolipoamide acyltransferase (E2) component
MATLILLPKLGFSMNEGVLGEWLVSDGAQVQEGAPLYTLESEKSAEEIVSPATGRLKIFKKPGESYKVGTELGEIE